MTIHPIHAGDGYTYLTRTVATGDRARVPGQAMTDYYLASGTPPGQWHGRGAEILRVSGDVTEEQMRALYGEGIHPDADLIILDALRRGASTAEALAAAKLGSGHHSRGQGPTAIAALYDHAKAQFLAEQQRPPSREEWAAMREHAAREHLLDELGHAPSPADVDDALADEKRRLARSVAAYDCVFTPQKSVSVLWGLADDDVRQTIWECHDEAMKETLDMMQTRYALARRGAGGVRQIDADGLTFALYQHFDNRVGDPNPHTHAVVSSRVLGSDGKWSALDARALYSATVSLSCQYNATLIGKLQRRLGLRFQERYRNGLNKAPVLEIADMPEKLITAFSRRPDILRATETLVREYRDKHGRNPSKKTEIHLAQAATLASRAAKPIPKTLREMLTEWAEETELLLDDGRTAQQFAADVIRLSHDPDAIRPYDATHAAIAAGIRLGGTEGVEQAARSHIHAAIEHALDRYEFTSDHARSAAAAHVAHLLDPANDNHLLDHVDRAATAADRAVYDPDRLAIEVLDTVSRRRPTWTEVHIRAAVEDRVALCRFDSDHAQRDAVEQVLSEVRARCFQLSIDPDPVPAALTRKGGENVYDTCAATTIRYTSEAILDAETALLDAARTPTPQFLTTTAVQTAITETEARRSQQLNAGQREIVRHLCTSGTRLAVAVGPAGTGKTTAMRAVSHAWISDGRDVMALAPQKSSARVLGEEIGVPARTIDAVLTLHAKGLDTGITAGAMLLVDEAGMASTHNLHALQRLAEETGAVVRWIGDPHQLSAVEAGGALRLLANDTHAPTLQEVVRFRDPDEAQASLHVRDGNPNTAWEFYKSSGRVVSGLAYELREQILTAHLDDLDEGLDSLMMAATLEDVHMLNAAAQSAYAQRGHVDTDSPGADLADGHTAHCGDLVVTRRNTSRLRITGGYRAGDPVDNGEQWRVRTVHDDGSLTVSGIAHHGHVHLPAQYVLDYTELGYASTVHRAQGMTVRRAYVLMGSALGRSLAYVGLTRGSEYNGIFLATDVLAEPDLHHAPDEALTEHQVWLRELGRRDDNISATETLREETARADDPDRLRETYDHARELLFTARFDDLLARAVPFSLLAQLQQSPHYSTLLETLDRAEQHEVNVIELVGLIATDRWRATEDGLPDTEDPAAVLRARADRHIARAIGRISEAGTDRFRALRDLPGLDVPPVPARYPGIDAELADFADELHDRLSNRAQIEELTTTPDRVTALSDLADALTIPADTDNLDARLARLHSDYEHRVHVLGRDWARHQLAETLPAGLHQQVQDGPDYIHLCDTLAAAHAAGLDTAALISEITDGEHGVPLLRGRDASAVLAARADIVLAQHHAETGDPLTAPAPTPVPPRHRGTDRAVEDHALDLAHQITRLRDLQRMHSMHADPIRMLDNTALDNEISRLRTAASVPDPMDLSHERTPDAVDALTTEHAILRSRTDCIRTAQSALDAAQHAELQLTAAAEQMAAAQARLDALPGIRVAARRDATAELAAAREVWHANVQAVHDARHTAEQAIHTAIAAGAPRRLWLRLLERDTDATRASELETAHTAEMRAQQSRARRTTARTTLSARLEKALAEKARRRALTDPEAAAEQRLRTTAPDSPTHERDQALPPHPETGRDLDHGAEL
ncbi:MobF family relaxase [Nocardia jejuensis]|uniref:MobF family relaxase n=1 Tax=Nocardia jejuensis TaxID=328049 RepID=UPI000834FD00|nr:MobF family relaxase [Nocardia jejuensis]